MVRRGATIIPHLRLVSAGPVPDTGIVLSRVRSEGWFLASLALLATIVVTDLVTPRSSLPAACTAPAFLASATCPPRRTAVVAGLALAIGTGLVLINDQDRLSNGVRVAVLLLTAVLAPTVSHLREQKLRHIAHLTLVARVAQDAVLTPVPAAAGRLRFATAYESAGRAAQIGGDLFAVVSRPGGSRLVVGDVRGKGLDGVRTSALTIATFREVSAGTGSLDEVAAACHRVLREHLADEDFVTAVFASIDDSGHTEVLSCGHPAPFLVHEGRLVSLEIPRPAGPLGLAVDAGAPETVRLRLEPGDRLLFFTDGLVEARDARGGFVDVEELVDIVRASAFDDALPGILARLHSTAGRIDDDLALLLVELAPSPAAGGAGSPGDGSAAVVSAAASPARAAP